MGQDRLEKPMIFDVIVPIAEADIASTKTIIKYWKMYLPIKRIIFIGNEKVRQLLESDLKEDFVFIDEDLIISFNELKQIIGEYTRGNKCAIRRTGWYLQQFLKMEFCKYCDDDYYLIWDSDTAPLKHVDMFSEGQPVFHLKNELRESYFITMGKIFDGFNKIIKESFISEHMLIKCSIMKKMLTDVDSNKKLIGDTWYEKIIRSIDINEVQAAGFSEFETYGTYCMIRFPEVYQCKAWKSYRGGGNFFEPGSFTEREAKWLAKEYDAVSFEKVQTRHKRYKLFQSGMVQKMFKFSDVVKAVGALDRVLGME